MDALTLWLIIAATATSVSVGCPYGWPHKDEQCFKLTPTRTTWNSASWACKADGGHLARSDSADVNLFLWQMIQPLQWPESISLHNEEKYVWLNAQRQSGHTTIWTWQDNFQTLEAGYTEWANELTEPKDPGQSCLVMHPGGGEWYSIECDSELASLCQVPAKGCYVCFLFSGNLTVKNPLATTDSWGLSGTLTTTSDDSDFVNYEDYVAILVNGVKICTIDLTACLSSTPDGVRKNTCVCTQQRRDKYQLYVSWRASAYQSGQPVYVRAVSRSLAYRDIDRLVGHLPKITDFYGSVRCHSPWSEFYDRWRKQLYCYIDIRYLSGPRLENYKEASDYCLKLSPKTKLAGPHGPNLQASSRHPTYMHSWDGNDRWLGVKYDYEQGQFTYNDGAAVDVHWMSWSPWQHGYPDHDQGRKNCTVINRGKWRNVDCNEKHGFLCEFKICGSDELSGWTKVRMWWTYNPHTDRCIKLHNEYTRFHRASQICEGENAIVETANTFEAADFLLDMVGPDEALWLGVSNIENENKWRWFDGTKATHLFRNKIITDPSQHDNVNVNCMYIQKQESTTNWYKYVCHMERVGVKFICAETRCRHPYQTVVVPLPHPYFLRKCYRCFNWDIIHNARQAGQICAKDGLKSNPSKLATLSSSEERDIVLNPAGYDLQQCSSGSKWIGYTFNLRVDKWQWNDNTFDFPLVTSRNGNGKTNNWPAHYTQDGGAELKRRAKLGQICVFTSPTDGLWEPDLCDQMYLFVCEKDQPFVLQGGCPTGADLGGHVKRDEHVYNPSLPPTIRMKCFYSPVDDENGMYYADADRFCRAIGGYILMPNSKKEAERALIFFQNNPTGTVVWVGADRINPNFELTNLDGSSFSWPDWILNKAYKNFDCVCCVSITADSYYMFNTTCSNRKKTVCQVDHSNIRAIRNFDMRTACQNDIDWYTTNGDFCYYTPPDEIDLISAVSKCKSLTTNSDIAKPMNDSKIRNFLLSRPGGVSTSIGVYSENKVLKWITGIEKNEASGSDEVITGGLVDIKQIKWYPGHPYNQTEQRCVVLNSVGLWFSRKCSSPSRYTCQKSAVSEDQQTYSLVNEAMTFNPTLVLLVTIVVGPLL